MFTLRLYRRCIALLAMLAGHLVPCAHLGADRVAGARPEGAVMVCTASGMLWVQADGDVQSDEGSRTLPDLKENPVPGAACTPWPRRLPRKRRYPCCAARGTCRSRSTARTRPAVWLGVLTRAPPALRG